MEAPTPPSHPYSQRRSRWMDILVTSAMVLAMCALAWKYSQNEPDLTKAYLSASQDTLNKCKQVADNTSEVAEYFGGRSKITILRACIAKSGDPGYEAAAKEFANKKMQKAVDKQR